MNFVLHFNNSSPKKDHEITFFSLKILIIRGKYMQKQSSVGVLGKSSGIMQQIYRRTTMPKCDFNIVAL